PKHPVSHLSGHPHHQRHNSQYPRVFMTLYSLPDLEYKRVVSCKDSFHATDVLAVSEHGAPGRRPNIHTHCRPAPPRQTEALSSRTSRSRPWKRRSQAVRERKTSVLSACRVPNPAN